jgi:ankyrin repeat protein
LCSGNLDSATDIILNDLNKQCPKSEGQILTQGALEARSRVLSYVSYILSGLASDQCLGNCTRLLQQIEDIDSRNQDGSTALHISAQLGLLDSVRSLLILKANISVKDSNDEIPATKAARHDACHRLLKSMEPISQSSDAGDESDLNGKVDPVMGTLEDVHELRVGMRVVLARGFEYVRDAPGGPLKWKEEGVCDSVYTDSVVVRKDYSAWSYGLQALSLAEPWDCGWSLLMVAAEAGNVEQIRSLLGAKADVEARTRRQRTSLHVAAYAGNRAAVIALLAGNANIEAKDDYGRTPLHVAAEQGFTDILSLLMPVQPEMMLGLQDRKCCTVLHYAATASGEAVRLLVRSKANVESKGPLQRTALHLAAATNRIDCLSALLELKANHQVVDEKGRSALDLCNSDSGKYILKMSGANGWTPLMVACERSGDEIRQYALENTTVSACFTSARKKEPFPSWFQEDIVFYAQLAAKQQKWKWGILESTLTQSADGMQIKKMKPDLPDYSCVLGSDVMEAGVHEWELMVDNVQSMWVGIARGVSENKLLASGPTRPGDDGYILVFHSADCRNPTVYGSKQPKVRSIPNAKYCTGDKLTFQLDTKRHILRLKINGAVVAVVSNVDDIGVRPYVCMDYTESISLVAQVSRVFNAGNVGEDVISGLNNVVWSVETDKFLYELLLEGSDFVSYSSRMKIYFYLFIRRFFSHNAFDSGRKYIDLLSIWYK